MGEMKLRRACDRCHNIKERCQWIGSDACQRCVRLNHECVTLRPVQKLGRKPRGRSGNHSITPEDPQPKTLGGFGNTSVEASSSDPSDQSYASHPRPVPVGRPISEDKLKELTTSDGVDERESELLNICFHDTDAAGQWTLGPTFCRRHAEDLFYRLKSALPQLKDAFISVACLMHSKSEDRAADLIQQIQPYCNNKAALSVSALRSLKVNGREDVATALVLSLVISTFGLFVADGDSAAVCAYTLDAIAPFYRSPDVVFAADEHAYLIALFYTELIDCVPHSRVPIMRYGAFSKAAGHVDRYMGLAAPLMSIFYDLCVFSHHLSTSRTPNAADVWRRSEELEHEIRAWKPAKPEGFPDSYFPVEVIQIFAQLKGLKQAALIMLHRLRYPYGIQDEKALALSDSIIDENALVLQFLDRGAAMGMDLAFRAI
ncbi:uncharacterized protein AB675_8617 [Cyphellophora attinorum]|uniref:Zn(2)-C6 fungal-type domain-containing protein n=1 Tax=Cyphellophora attinorum TaxID=1664694 RepID=A0A0N0NQS7_9EURO|nr:uncharacterized protein AB675_8617 [Phialophora attinorum]KPI44258.1 hypothetical protein AB675_8617 [Phialophora attinorum]